MHHLLTIDEVAGIALALPGVVEGERGQQRGRTWSVEGKAFAWERPLTEADIGRLGDARVPAGPIVALQTGDLSEKFAILSDAPPGAFDLAHFADYPGYLIELGRTTSGALREAVIDAWLSCAPRDLASAFREKNP
jgi:hypothetical protein